MLENNLSSDFNNRELIMLCHQFEEVLSDYLDGSLEAADHRAAAAHSQRCPMCHELLNEVKTSLAAFREIAVPEPSLNMAAGILERTIPQSVMSCGEFENLLTDYLDGFLPAALFHRWERHVVTCSNCNNLPGEVVRSIGACYTFKAEELPVPTHLHERILQATLGTENAAKVKMSRLAEFKQTLGGIFKPLFSPLLTPQFASVAMMLLMAFVIFTNVGSADGSITGVYRMGMQLAAQTYQESSGAVENGLSESLSPNKKE